MSLRINLEWQRMNLLEGVLHLHCFVDRRDVGEYTSHPIALAGSAQTFSIQLPWQELPYVESKYTIKAEFLDVHGQRYELDDQDIPVPRAGQRILTIGLVTPEKSLIFEGFVPRLPESISLQACLSLERFTDSTAAVERRDLKTRVERVSPPEIPVDSWKLTAFDELYLTHEGFTSLREGQLAAIQRWVEGGGAICVAIPDTKLDVIQQSFLNRLAGGTPSRPRLAFESGKLVRPDELQGDCVWGNPGLGRVALCLAQVDFSSPLWTQTILKLHGVTPDSEQQLLATERWPDRREIATEDLGNQLAPFKVMPVVEPSSIERRGTGFLFPQSVRGLPKSTVISLLMGCLLVIGPVDYFGLGWLKKRKWTWVFFPATTLLFSGFTAFLAFRHLGKTDVITSITIVDLASDGHPVRKTVLELIYPNQTKIREVDNVEAGFVGFDTLGWRSGESHQYAQFQFDQSRQIDRLDFSHDKPIDYTGSPPQKYKSQISLNQWEARLFRQTTFLVEELPKTSLQTVDWGVSNRELKEQLRQLKQVEWFDGQASETMASSNPQSPVYRFLESISIKKPSKFFNRFATRAPTGTCDLEDLLLADASQLIGAWTEIAPQQYLVYRRPRMPAY